MNNKEVIEYLFEICQNNLQLKPGSEPGDLLHHNALDSFLSVICQIVKDNTQTKDLKQLFDFLHLATGTRTPFV
jgi:hypothetical protein